MSRLVVVSNRVADLSNTAQAGGLAVAMDEALKSCGGGIWFGWDGNTVVSGTKVPPKKVSVGDISLITLPLTKRDYRDYYSGFCNRVLWPLLHYRLDLVRYKTVFLNAYRRVNRKFANALKPQLKARDIIWVHDYHLFPLGKELRGLGCTQKIGFFLHVPFPPPDILAAASQHEWLIKSMFSYDLIGFQTEADLANFRRYVIEVAGGTENKSGTFEAFGQLTRAGHFPIGIDADKFHELSMDPEAEDQIKLQALRQQLLNRKTIIGVDRLDYSKGLPDRFRAFERLLELFPEKLKKVTFMQIAPPTRSDVEAYKDIRDELEKLSGAINGKYADFDWVPLRYIHRSIERKTLAALFRHSEVGFVSPLRDGMNLVAKEYIAAQDATNPGVLVLSKFAGAAETLEEALIINPYDVDEMANTLNMALAMPLKERKQRHSSLLKRVREENISNWHQQFLASLAGKSPGVDR
jgi:trehalose 6-phosphate synthase